MVINQISQDTAGVHALWRLIDRLSQSAHGVSPSSGDGGFEFGLQALIVLLAILVLAIFALSGAILYIFSQWRKDQAAGVKALSSSKDATKREITDLLKAELGNARSAAASDTKDIRNFLKQHGDSLNLIYLDLAIIGQKLKIPIRSGNVTQPPKEGGD